MQTIGLFSLFKPSHRGSIYCISMPVWTGPQSSFHPSSPSKAACLASSSLLSLPLQTPSSNSLTPLPSGFSSLFTSCRVDHQQLSLSSFLPLALTQLGCLLLDALSTFCSPPRPTVCAFFLIFFLQFCKLHLSTIKLFRVLVQNYCKEPPPSHFFAEVYSPLFQMENWLLLWGSLDPIG